MKLSQMRPCDGCGKDLKPRFYVMAMSLAAVDEAAAIATFGKNRISVRAGVELAMLEAQSPDPEIVKLAGSFDPKLWWELFLCVRCWSRSKLSLAQLVEKRLDTIERAIIAQHKRVQDEEAKKPTSEDQSPLQQ